MIQSGIVDLLEQVEPDYNEIGVKFIAVLTTNNETQILILEKLN